MNLDKIILCICIVLIFCGVFNVISSFMLVNPSLTRTPEPLDTSSIALGVFFIAFGLAGSIKLIKEEHDKRRNKIIR